MSDLIQADGDFDVWADLVEGLDKLPADYAPKLQGNGHPFRVLLAVRRRTESERYAVVSFGVGLKSGLQEVKENRRWFENLGHSVALWTPPLPPEEAERYYAALDGYASSRVNVAEPNPKKAKPGWALLNKNNAWILLMLGWLN